jgi:hypothetical protein
MFFLGGATYQLIKTAAGDLLLKKVKPSPGQIDLFSGAVYEPKKLKPKAAPEQMGLFDGGDTSGLISLSTLKPKTMPNVDAKGRKRAPKGGGHFTNPATGETKFFEGGKFIPAEFSAEAPNPTATPNLFDFFNNSVEGRAVSDAIAEAKPKRELKPKAEQPKRELKPRIEPVESAQPATISPAVEPPKQDISKADLERLNRLHLRMREIEGLPEGMSRKEVRDKIAARTEEIKSRSALYSKQLRTLEADASPSEVMNWFLEIDTQPSVTPIADSGAVIDSGTTEPEPETPARKIQPFKSQKGGPEKNVGKLLNDLGIASDVLAGEDYHRRIHNGGYLPLVVERHDDQLFLSHYISQGGDLITDSGMVFQIGSEGHLALRGITYRGPFGPVCVNAREGKSFAAMFSKNLLDQGFNKANLDDGPELKAPIVEPEELAVEPMTEPLGEAIDYKLVRGKKTRGAANRAAADLVANQDSFTDDEKALLSKYSGRGGLGGDDVSLNEYYTRPDIAKFAIDILYQHGFKGGTMVEPSCGAGVFLSQGDRPGLKMIGCEVDATSSKIARALNPHAEVVGDRFERFCLNNAETKVDAIVGNAPFGVRMTTKDFEANKYKSQWKRNEDLFMDASMDMLAPGGMMSMIVPYGVVSGGDHQAVRESLALKGRVIGVYRLPESAFKHSDTQVVTDTVVMQKHPQHILDAIAAGDQSVIDAVSDPVFASGGYFDNHPQNVLGTVGTKRRGDREMLSVKGDLGPNELAAAPAFAAPAVDYAGIAGGMPDRELQVGDEKSINGKRYRLNANHRWELVDEVEAIAAADFDNADPSAYGTDSIDAAEAMVTDIGQRVNIPANRLEAFMDLAGDRATRDALRDADNAAAKVDDDQAPKIAHAMILAAHIEQLQKKGGDDHALEQALNLLQEYREKYGNPHDDRALSKLALVHTKLLKLQGAFNADGKISDYFSDNEAVTRSIERTQQSSLFGAVGEAFRGNSSEGVSLDMVRDFYPTEATDPDLMAELLSDPTIGYSNGLFSPAESLLQGNGLELMAEFESQRSALAEQGLENSPQYRKLSEQIESVGGMMQYRSIDDMTIPLRAVGKWLDVEILNEFARDRNDNQFEWNEREGKFRIKQTKAWVSRSEEDVLNTINGDRLNRGSKTPDAKAEVAEYAEEFKQWIAASEHRLGVEEAYNAAYNSDIVGEYSGEALSIPGIEQTDTKKLHNFQNSTIRQMADRGRGIIALGVGLGKAQPLDAKILTPDGWKRMGDIQVGDAVINSQGGVSSVTGVFPQGDKAIYEVVFKDGASTECCDEHLWPVWESHDLARGNPYRVMSLREIMDAGVLRKAGEHEASKWAIPSVQPINFPERALPLDPYLVGALLGDGNLSTTGGTLRISSADDELLDEIRGMLPTGYELRYGGQYDWRITAGNRGGERNIVSEYLKDLGVNGLRSHEKFIPDLYKFASIQDRVSLLQGLLDTDGSTWAAKRGATTVEFCCVSEQLTEDVAFLVQSLGGMAHQSKRTTFYTYKGERREGKDAYRVRIKLPSSFHPFRLSRKAATYVPPSKYPPCRFLKAVNYVGVKPAQCISVDAPDHLYITDDCIVTHNTATAIALSQHLKNLGRTKKPTVVVPKSVLANWFREASFWGDNLNVLVVGMSQQFWGDGSPAWEVPGMAFKTKGGNPLMVNGKYQLYRTDDPNKAIVAMTEEEVQKRGNLAFKDDDAATKQKKLQQLAQNSYDLVLMSEPVFQSIPLTPDREYDNYQEIMGRHISDSSAGNKKKGYELEKRKQTFMAKLSDRRGKKSEITYWEDLGVDAIFHDEAHHLKNLFGVMRSGDIAFLNTPESNRSLDFYNKAKYTREQNNGQNVYLLTATPTTNNPLEAFNMLQHVAPEEFDKRGIENIDDFLEMFGKIESVMVPGVDLEMTTKNSLTGFKNLKDLRSLFGKFTRMQSAKEVGLVIPEEAARDVQVDMTPAQAEVYEGLRQRADDLLSGKTKDDEDHIFSVISDMDKAAIDLEYYNATTTTGEPADLDTPESRRSPKIEASVKQIMQSRGQSSGKQIMFCDAVQLHEKLKAQLVAAGYPENEIQIVNAKTVPKSSDRQKISQAYNDGRISLVIGNTATMGEGMNFQVGTTDIHHLTTPWTPAAIEQRNGRGVRQGNKADEVNIHYYAANKTFDLYRKGVLERKRGWIDDLWKGDSDTADNKNTGSIGADEMAVMMAADPEAARKAMNANRELQMQRLAASKGKDALKRFGQLQTMQAAFSKTQDQESPKARQLQARIDSTVAALRRDEHFPHKDLLDGAPAYIGPKGDVARQNGYITGSSGEVYRITNIDPAKRSMDLIPVLGGSYRPFSFNADESKTIKFGDMEKRYESIGMDDHVLTQRRIAAVDSYTSLRHLTQDEMDGNRDALTQSLRKGYSKTPIETSTGEVKFVRGDEIGDGDRVLFPGDAGVIDKAVGAIAKAHDSEYSDYQYREAMEQMTGQSWFSEIHPKIKAMRAASAPKEGDTKTDNGIEYVLRGGRWHRSEEAPPESNQPLSTSAPSPSATDEPVSTSPEAPSTPNQENLKTAIERAVESAQADGMKLGIEPKMIDLFARRIADHIELTGEGDTETIQNEFEDLVSKAGSLGRMTALDSMQVNTLSAWLKTHLEPAIDQPKPATVKDTDPIGTIHQALQALSDNDDGARSIDGAGFNKMDTDFGNDLAGKQRLTENQARAALKMLQKYKGQLGRSGIELPSLDDMDAAVNAPKPEGTPSIPSEIKDAFNKKKGIPHHVVVLGAQVDRDVYERLNSKAKSMGGYYSAFKGTGAVPGFQFTDRESAEAFQAEVSRFEKAAAPKFLYVLGDAQYVFRDGALHRYAV